jgi:hypothetical protein
MMVVQGVETIVKEPKVTETTTLQRVDYEVRRVEEVETKQRVVEPEEPAPGSAGVRELLDSIEERVEALRRAALALAEERAGLLASLGEVAGCTRPGGQLEQLQQIEREEVGLEVERLAHRVQAVRVEVATVRSAGQVEALRGVEAQLGSLVRRLQDTAEGPVEARAVEADCRAFLAACGGLEASGSHRFEGLVLGCAAGDQKRVKARLELLLEQILAFAASQEEGKEGE